MSCIAHVRIDKKVYESDLMQSFQNSFTKAERQYNVDFKRMSVYHEGEECTAPSNIPRRLRHLCTQASFALPLILATNIVSMQVLDSGVRRHRACVDVWNNTVILKKKLGIHHPVTMQHIRQITMCVIISLDASFVDITIT